MKLIDADEAFRILSAYYHHRTETQADALREALELVPEAGVRCERIVELINDLIDNAVHHGADCGGAYFTNEEGLIESAHNLLDALNLNGRYAVKKLPGWHDSWSDIAVSEKHEPSEDGRCAMKAKWDFITEPAFGNSFGSYICSRCGAQVAHKENFCPSCGARMDAAYMERRTDDE